MEWWDRLIAVVTGLIGLVTGVTALVVAIRNVFWSRKMEASKDATIESKSATIAKLQAFTSPKLVEYVEANGKLAVKAIEDAKKEGAEALERASRLESALGAETRDKQAAKNELATARSKIQQLKTQLKNLEEEDRDRIRVVDEEKLPAEPLDWLPTPGATEAALLVRDTLSHMPAVQITIDPGSIDSGSIQILQDENSNQDKDKTPSQDSVDKETMDEDQQDRDRDRRRRRG